MATSCNAGPNVRDVQVRQLNGSPCFSVENAPETRAGMSEVGALSVYEAQPDGREVWAIGSTGRDDFLLSPGSCVGYGEVVEGAKALIPSSPLTTGKIYGVSIKTSLKQGENRESRQYSGFFCLVSVDGGQVAVHHVLWDERRSAWAWESCGVGVHP